MRVRRFACLLSALTLSALFAAPAQAVMLYRSPSRNTSPPSGSFYNAGWQWEGLFGNFLGTAIAPHYFLTASHIGGNVGQSFTFQGKVFHTTAMYDDPSTDLRIWKV